MRTTLTLDDDVAAALERLRKSQDANLSDLVNEVLRQGLKRMTGPPKHCETIQTRAVSLGHCRVDNVDNVADALPESTGGLVY